jgi:hypothetical protein
MKPAAPGLAQAKEDREMVRVFKTTLSEMLRVAVKDKPAAFREGFQLGWRDAAEDRPQSSCPQLDESAMRSGLLEEEFADNAAGYTAGYAAALANSTVA